MFRRNRIISLLLLLACFCLIFCHSELHLEHCGQFDHQSHHDYCQLVQSSLVTSNQPLQMSWSIQWIALPLQDLNLLDTTSLEQPVSRAFSESAAGPLLYLCHHTLRI